MQKFNQTQKTLGARLRDLRIKSGHTSIQKFTKENKISRVLYTNWEKGKGNMTFSNIVRMAKIFKISIKDFFSQGFEE